MCFIINLDDFRSKKSDISVVLSIVQKECSKDEHEQFTGTGAIHGVDIPAAFKTVYEAATNRNHGHNLKKVQNDLSLIQAALLMKRGL